MNGAVSATLSATGWSGSNGSYTQTLTVTGVDSDKTIISCVPSSASLDAKKAYINSEVECTGQGTNSVTYSATSIPSVAIPVAIQVI